MGQMLVRETAYGDTALNHFTTGKSNGTLKSASNSSYITQQRALWKRKRLLLLMYTIYTDIYLKWLPE